MKGRRHRDGYQGGNSLGVHHSMACWLDPCYISTVADSRVVLSAPTELARDWVVENYLDRLREILGCDVEVVADEGSGKADTAKKEALDGEA